MDLDCTAVGKVILAFGGADVLQRVLAKQVYLRHTRNTITSPKLMQREVRASASRDTQWTTRRKSPA
jgi:DNA-binding IclR family transcriptional regulator